MTTKNKPATTLRCAITFSRSFKDAEGQWRNGTTFGLNDLEALLKVAKQAQA